VTALLLGLTLVGMGVVPMPPPPRDQPEPKVHVEARPTEAPELTGRASWYAYVPGGAAAGPKLRSMLGKDWRGTKVDVCKDGTCIQVTLSDWCQCYKGEKRERIIDLDVRSFDALGDPGDGLMKVTVREQRRPAYRGGSVGSTAAVRLVPAGVGVGRTVGGARPTESLT
jgi:hypothetical protein